jgi:alpha-tubulin suppressor-like RCC1 family protein
LLDTHRVRCWGLADFGGLGYGNTEPVGITRPPSAAGDLDLGGDVVQLTAGAYHTCALLEGGRVRCWGFNVGGVLGYGHTRSIGDNETPASAGDLSLGGVAVRLVAGAAHTCAMLDTGGVRCWGVGVDGPLGYGNQASIGDNDVPSSVGEVRVALDRRVIQLANGVSRTCALLDDGTVRCWGRGTSGQLGHGNTTNIGDDELPAAVGAVPIGERVVSLAARGGHTCAVVADGLVRCWGEGFYGVLGYAGTAHVGDDETPAEVGDVDVGGGAVQALALGVHHTCALMASGGVRCWGSGGGGALGLGLGNRLIIGDDEVPASVGEVAVVP